MSKKPRPLNLEEQKLAASLGLCPKEAQQMIARADENTTKSSFARASRISRSDVNHGTVDRKKWTHDQLDLPVRKSVRERRFD